jgi:hypothetical protein
LLKAVAKDPVDRFETAEEFLLALERGASKPLATPQSPSLAKRNPLALWRAIAVILFITNLLFLYLITMH